MPSLLAHSPPVNILVLKVAVVADGNVLVDPIVGAEPDGVRNGEVEARVPVDQDQDREDHFADAKHVRKVGSRLRLVEELVDSRHSETATTYLGDAARCSSSKF